MLLRIIDKETKFFIRDDFTYNEDTEFGLDTTPAQGFHKPIWTGELFEDEEGNITIGEGEWVEGATQEEIDELTKPQPQEPTELEVLQQTVDSIFTDVLPSLFE